MWRIWSEVQCAVSVRFGYQRVCRGLGGCKKGALSIYINRLVWAFPGRKPLKALKSVTFDLLFIEIMFLVFKNTVI